LPRRIVAGRRSRLAHRCARERRQHLREREAQRFLIVRGDESRELEEILRKRGTSVRSSTIGCSFSRGTSVAATTSTTTPVSERRASERARARRDRRRALRDPVVERRFGGDGKGNARDRHERQARRFRAPSRPPPSGQRLQCAKCSPRAAATGRQVLGL
jgi:hypothetical protein